MKIAITIIKALSYLAYQNGIDATVDKRQSLRQRTSIRKASSVHYGYLPNTDRPKIPEIKVYASDQFHAAAANVKTRGLVSTETTYQPNETCSVYDKSDFSFQLTDDEDEPMVTYLYDVATEENSTTIGHVDLCAISEFVTNIGEVYLEHHVLISNQVVEESIEEFIEGSIAPYVPSYFPNETCSVHDKSDFSFQLTDDEDEPFVAYLYDVATEENSTTIGHVDLCAISEFGGIDLEHYVLISNQVVEESIGGSIATS